MSEVPRRQSGPPAAWVAPTWHEDAGDPSTELDLLRAFATSLLEQPIEDLAVTLDCFEDGYMAIEVARGRQPVVEVHVVAPPAAGGSRRLGVFLLVDGDEEGECYLDDPSDAAAHVASVLAAEPK